MNLNLTVNESCGGSTSAPITGTFYVRAFYTEIDAGHLSGPFGTKQAAEQAVVALLARTGVVKATIEEGV